MLWTFDSNKPLIIETDTSDHITAEVASQERQSLKFISKKMNSAEQNYMITEKEMLVIIQVVKEWRKYLEESKEDNQVIMDHKNLTYFKEVWIMNRRQVRWAFEVQDVPFELKYQKGKDNIVADVLTRKKDERTSFEDRVIFL